MTTTQQPVTTFAGWRISTGFLSGNLIGSGDASVDELASASRYAEVLREHLADAFRGATIEVNWEAASGSLPFGLQTSAYGTVAMSDEADVCWQVDAIHQHVFENPDWWVSYLPTPARIQQVLDDWHAAEAIEKGIKFANQHEKVAREGSRYIRLDAGNDGAYMMDKSDGTIYRIRSYGEANLQQPVGNIATVDGATLHALRYVRWTQRLKKELGF